MASKNANEGRMKPTYEQLEKENKELRARAHTCEFCDYMKALQNELVKAAREFVAAEKRFKNRAFVSTVINYGSERPRSWRSALRKLHDMTHDLPAS